MPMAGNRLPARTRCADPDHPTAHDFACQISVAYWAILWSLENFPEPATFRIASLARPSVLIGVQRGQPLVRLEIGFKVGQVHAMISVRQQ